MVIFNQSSAQTSIRMPNININVNNKNKVITKIMPKMFLIETINIKAQSKSSVNKIKCTFEKNISNIT